MSTHPECASHALDRDALGDGQDHARRRAERVTGYKTILVQVDATQSAAARIGVAARLALRHDAHLIGIALTGVSRYFYREAEADLLRTVLAPHLDALYRRTEAALARFSRLAAQERVPSWEPRLVDDETGAGLALCARYADLVVLGRPDPDAPAPPGGTALDCLLESCPRPLLVMPPAAAADPQAARILVAWTDSPQDARALSAALPLLRRAGSVTAVAFGPPGGRPGADWLLPYLARHGIAAHRVDESIHQDMDERLLALADGAAADLLVMGAQNRLARGVLRNATVPVLLAA